MKYKVYIVGHGPIGKVDTLYMPRRVIGRMDSPDSIRPITNMAYMKYKVYMIERATPKSRPL